MANKTTVALSVEQYIEIIITMRTGGAGFRANEKIADALMLEANLGMRISDILSLTPKSIIKDGPRYRLDVIQQKTGKTRPFTVPNELYEYFQNYCKKYNIKENERLFPYTERNIQIYLSKVADYLGYENIGTHSFRKYYGTDIFIKNNYNIILVQKLLQHSSPAITQAYLGITSKEMEEAIHNHLLIC